MVSELCLEKDHKRLKECRLFLLDMDGTLYLGDEVYEGAIDFIRFLERTGRDYIYLTNNSSRAGEDYITRLRGLGFPCERKNVYTSGMACGSYLMGKYRDKSVYGMGTRAFLKELGSYGVKLINTAEAPRDIKTGGGHEYACAGHDTVDVVCVGFDTELVYEDLNIATHYLRRGAVFIAANPDLVCPMSQGEVLPDCGSICRLLTSASGVEPYYIGKPNRSMVDVIAAERGIENDKICCIGDRLYTDIAVAQNAEAVSLLVLSGETSREEAAALSRPDSSQRPPDYVFNSVAELIDLW